jgi:hypothetical protein
VWTQSGDYVWLYFRRIWAGFVQEFAPPCLAMSLFLVAETLHSDSNGSSRAFIQALRGGLRGIDAVSQEHKQFLL